MESLIFCDSSNTDRILVMVETLDFSTEGTGSKQAGLSLSIHSFVTDTATACQNRLEFLVLCSTFIN